MKCVICKSGNLSVKEVEEEIRNGNDIALLKMEIMVCENCGERYYNRNDITRLEQIKKNMNNESLQLEEIGKVVLVHP
jgi:YgiT-type zinc finger domain-containing protein